MSMTLAAGALCLSLLNPATASIEPEKVDLAYTYRSGEPMRYTQTKSNTMMQIMGAQVQVMSEESVSEITRERIESRDDGSLVVRQAAESFTYKETNPGGEFVFDSKSEEDADKRGDQRVRSIYEGLGWGTEYVITPKGEVVGIDNLKELGQQIDQAAGDDLKAELREAFSQETLVRQVGPFMHLLPDGPVGVGDTWVRTFTIADGGMTMTATQNMEVESLLEWKDGHYVRVSFEGDLDIGLPETFPPFLKLTEQTIKGYFIFNTHYGTVSDYRGTLHFKVEGSPGEGMGNMVMTVDLGMAYKLKND